MDVSIHRSIDMICYVDDQTSGQTYATDEKSALNIFQWTYIQTIQTGCIILYFARNMILWLIYERSHQFYCLCIQKMFHKGRVNNVLIIWSYAWMKVHFDCMLYHDTAIIIWTAQISAIIYSKCDIICQFCYIYTGCLTMADHFLSYLTNLME